MSFYLNKIKESYFDFINKKTIKTSLEVLLIIWFIFIFLSYSYYKDYLPLLIIVCAFLLALILILRFVYNKKINKDLFQKAIKYFFPKDKYNFKVINIIILIPIATIALANIILLFSLLFSSELTVKDFLFYEYNLIIKILQIYLFYYSLTLITYALGNKILKLFKIKTETKTESFLFAIGIGFIPFIIITLIISILGYLYGWLAWIILILFTLVSLPEIKKIIKELKTNQISFKFTTPFRSFKSFTFILICFLFIVSIIIAFEPSPNDVDSLHSYYNTANLFAHYHQYQSFDYFSNANLGHNTEMIYAFIISLLNAKYLAHFSLFFFILLIGGFYYLIKNFLNKKIAVLSIYTVFFIPWNFLFAQTNKVEMFLCFYSLLALINFFIWLDKKDNKQLLLMGIFLGIALGIKYTAFFISISLYAAIILLFIFRKQFNFQNTKHLFLSACLVLLFFTPWLIKNTYYFNNPLYPYEYIFENRETNIFQTPDDYRNSRLQEVSYLRNSIYYDKYQPVNILKIFFNQSTGKDSEIGPWIDFGFAPILILPFFFMLKPRKNLYTFLGIIILYFMVWFLIAIDRPWYGIFGITLLYSLLPFVLKKYKYLIKIYSIYIITILIFIPFISENLSNSAHAFYYLTGTYDKEKFLEENIKTYKIMPFINNELNLTADNKLLSNDLRIAYINENDKKVILDMYFYNIGYLLNQGEDIFLQKLKENKINYILIANYTYNYYDNWVKFKGESVEEYLENYNKSVPSIYQDAQKFKNFLENHTQLIKCNEESHLYKLSYESQ